MKIRDIKPIAESTAFKLGPENNYLLDQIIAGKPLSALHYILMAKLLALFKTGADLNKTSVAETAPTKADIDEVKALDSEKLRELAREFKDATNWPPIMFDYFPAYSTQGKLDAAFNDDSSY